MYNRFFKGKKRCRRSLDGEDRLMFLEAISTVAPRYAPPKPPRDSRALMRSVSQRSRGTISLNGCEEHTIASVVASEMLLPLPFHSCLLSFCHAVHLLYVLDLPVSNSLWRALGATHTFFVHLIAEFTECGSTNTLYLHGLSHVWFGDRLSI